jgi:predicted ATPase
MVEMNNEKIKALKSILKTMDKFIKLTKQINKLPADTRKILEAKNICGPPDDKVTETLIKEYKELKREIEEIEAENSVSGDKTAARS